jgi:hypothetical protein
MTMRYSMETMREIWDDKHGDCVEVGPDRDGLDMVEIRCKTDDGAMGPRMSLPAEKARLVAQAMIACADDLDAANAPRERTAVAGTLDGVVGSLDQEGNR